LDPAVLKGIHPKNREFLHDHLLLPLAFRIAAKCRDGISRQPLSRQS
jgi:hypothetical protein